MLELSGVTKHFGALKVLDGLDLSVASGEVMGVIGPNGAGKTTLFNVIAGVLSPNTGSVLFEGRDLGKVRVWDRCRLGIARTYQVPRPFTHMSAFENVMCAALHGGDMGMRAASEKAEEVLESVAMAHRSPTPAGELSLLDLKRLELAKALASEPRLLLLDEIAGGLTEAECEVLLEIVGVVRDRGTTIVWIEHVIHALRRIASRIAVLYGGSIITTGAPDAELADQRVKQVYLGVGDQANVADALLDVADLSVFYGKFRALFGVSLTVGEGEIVSIIGANGAGKSSLLKAIVGQADRIEGSIRFDGKDLAGVPTAAIVADGIALVPEGRRLFPSLTVEENLNIGWEVGRRGAVDQEAIYSYFPVLKERRGQRASELSGGQQQMVALGRGLLANPRLLLCDEISLGLAPVIIDDLYKIIPAIRERGVSILLVEQDIGRSLAVADRFYCLLEGKVNLAGRPAEISREAVVKHYFGV